MCGCRLAEALCVSHHHHTVALVVCGHCHTWLSSCEGTMPLCVCGCHHTGVLCICGHCLVASLCMCGCCCAGVLSVVIVVLGGLGACTVIAARGLCTHIFTITQGLWEWRTFHKDLTALATLVCPQTTFSVYKIFI